MKNFPGEMIHGSGTRIVLDRTRLLIEFVNPHQREEIEQTLSKFGMELEPNLGSLVGPDRPRAEIINHTDRRLWVKTRSGNAIDQPQFDALRAGLGDRVSWVGPVYTDPNAPGRGGRLCPLPNVLVLRPARTAGTPGNVDPFQMMIRKLGLQEDAERSKYLAGYRVFNIAATGQTDAYQLRDAILREYPNLVSEVKFENMPMVRDLTFVPNDPLYPQQWGMAKINAGGPGTTGWDLSTGAATTIVAVLDYSFDLAHPELTFVAGVDLGTMGPATSGSDPHGTACAGIIAAHFNNSLGVAGLAGGCRIMPVVRVSGSDVETATGINWAANNGAAVLSMSFGRYAMGEGGSPTGWDFTLIDPAIANAVNVRGSVLCAATGNEDLGAVNRYPARHALVIACGASDQADNRKNPASPDAEPWGSNYGSQVYLGVTTGVTVVAPGVLIPTTDIQGTGGYNPAAGTAGDYFMTFNGTSSATPHVAGLAGLLRSLYPALTNIQVRDIVERTAEKVGAVAYAEAAGFGNGSRNQQMGYGRINVYKALDYADTLIRDWSGDDGMEPSTPPGGDFWDFSDLVVRPSDDSVFNPSDPFQSNRVERGQTNYIYVRVKNNGPQTARNVQVIARITPWVGLEFAYPGDWTLIDANHVSPAPVTTSFATIAPGASVMAKFTVSSAQVETMWGWISGMSWHPCMLAAVFADNDYAFSTAVFATPPLTPRRNNLAQRNLTVVDDVLSADSTFPFLAGHLLNLEQTMEIVVDRTLFAAAQSAYLLLELDAGIFPARVPEEPAAGHSAEGCTDEKIEFLSRARIRTKLGCCRGVLTLEKGSFFCCEHSQSVRVVNVEGGEIVQQAGKTMVRLTAPVSVIRVAKQPGAVYPMGVRTFIPSGTERGTIRVSQRNESGVTVGGATVLYTRRQPV